MAIEIEAPVNGRVGPATVRYVDDAGDVQFTDKGDLDSQTERVKISKQMAKRFQLDPRKVCQQIEAAWNQVMTERRIGNGSGDPTGPAKQPWSDPVPLDEVPDVPAFPVEVLPERLRRLVEEASWAYNCPADFLGVPMLALTGGALGNSRHIAITRTHTQPPCIYAAVSSPPGTAKSPALKLLRRPFDLAQQRRLEQWHRDMEDWKRRKEAKKDSGEPTGPRPIPSRCIVSDITTESLGLVLAENPRGVVQVKDELVGLVAGMNQYKSGKGNDRQVYLALWSGDTIIIDRKSDKDRDGAPLYVTDPFTGIVGGLQPAVLDRLRGESVRGVPPPDDGFLDRFLIVYPADVPAAGEQWREIARETLDGWHETVDRLLGLQMTVETEPEGAFAVNVRTRPFFVPLTACGRQAWQRFTRAHADEINAPDFPPHLAGAWAKLKGYGARLALIVHYLRWACGEVQDEHIDEESMDRAALLVSYFKAHTRKVRAVMGGDPRIVAARKVVRWIVDRQVRQFSKRGAYQGLKGTFKTVEELESVLAVVERHGLIRPELSSEPSGPGRRPSPTYEVHPAVLQSGSHNSHNPHNSDSGNSGNSGNESKEGKGDAWEG